MPQQVLLCSPWCSCLLPMAAFRLGYGDRGAGSVIPGEPACPHPLCCAVLGGLLWRVALCPAPAPLALLCCGACCWRPQARVRETVERTWPCPSEHSMLRVPWCRGCHSDLRGGAAGGEGQQRLIPQGHGLLGARAAACTRQPAAGHAPHVLLLDCYLSAWRAPCNSMDGTWVVWAAAGVTPLLPLSTFVTLHLA